LPRIYFNLKNEYLTKGTLEGFGDFEVKEQVILTLRYADDLVLRAEEETVIQSMIDKLIETGRFYGMKMNVE